MPDDPKHETFVSTATIYKPGTGLPFAPGSEVTLHPDHAAEFRKAGLEQPKPIQEPVQDSRKPGGKKD
jgi:hypothetical protein